MIIIINQNRSKVTNLNMIIQTVVTKLIKQNSKKKKFFLSLKGIQLIFTGGKSQYFSFTTLN